MKSYLVCQKHVREYALEISRLYRGGKFKRVSSSFVALIESKTKAAIESAVKSHPTLGRTLK